MAPPYHQFWESPDVGDKRSDRPEAICPTADNRMVAQCLLQRSWTVVVSDNENWREPDDCATDGEGQSGRDDSFFAITIGRNTRKEIYSNGRRGGC